MKYFEGIRDFLEKYNYFVTEDTKYWTSIQIKPFDLDPIFAIRITYFRRLKVYEVEFVSFVFKTKKINFKDFWEYHKRAVENKFSFILVNAVAEIKDKFAHSRYCAEEDNIIFLSLLKSYEKVEEMKNDIEFVRKFFKEFLDKFSRSKLC